LGENPIESLKKKRQQGNQTEEEKQRQAALKRAFKAFKDSSILNNSISVGGNPIESRKKKRQLGNQTEKEKERQVAAQYRQQQKAQKQREKEENETQRRKEKDERAMIKAATTQDKLNRKVAAQQTMGHFAKEEICMLVEPKLLKNGEWKDTFDQICESYDSVEALQGVSEGSIQFIRRKYVDGGGKSAFRALERNNQNGYHLVFHLVILFSVPDDFLKLLERSDDDDDYPKLEEWLEEKYTLWKSKWGRSENPRLMILLPGVLEEIHKNWNGASRKDRDLLSTDADLDDAIVWLRVAFQVECQLFPSKEKVTEFLLKMTRAISSEPYRQNSTELECVCKIKTRLENPAQASTIEIANDTWIRMLQQLPGMSAQRAESLAQFYPTFRSLMQAYNSTEVEGDKRLMVAHLLHDKVQLKKLSEQLYRTMTAKDSKALLI